MPPERWCETCSTPLTRATQRRFCSRRCHLARFGPRRGTTNGMYNGGLAFNRRLGRWVIVCRDGTLMYFYRGVMAAEIGRLLLPDEIVHHRNGDPTDDRASNLRITTRAEHVRIHQEMRA